MASRLQALWGWFDSRMPTAAEQWRIHASQYYAPKNFNFWYYFGSLAGLVLIIQIVSAFFIVVYLHMFRALLYGSHRAPRELVWIFGVLIYLTLMGEAFFGYLLPWGQMSYWGAQVIVNLFGSIPFIGPDLALWIRG